MKSFLKTFLAVVLAQIFLGLWGVLLLMGFIAVAISGTTEIPEHCYLVQSVGGEIPEYVPPMTLSPFDDAPPNHTSLLENLEKAGADDRIRGVVLEVWPSDLGMGKRDEIRQRIRQLRERGKSVYAFGRYLTTMDYYMVSGCDSILVTPDGLIELHGLALEAQFFKGTLDGVGVNPNIHQIAEFKSAAESITRRDLSDEARENAQWLLDDIFKSLVTTISADRGLSEDTLLAAMELAQLNPSMAFERGLVDGLVYWEDLETLLGADDVWKTVDGKDYVKVERKDVGLSGPKRIAIVHAQGVIGSGDNGYAFPFGLKMGSGAMTRALNDVRKDTGIHGVILRVDSPGGSSIASDDISYAVKLLNEEKPTVVSMVDMAASGGYMISYRCSTIVALPNTLTGSIGSITGKFNAKGMYDHLGVTKDFVTVGPRPLINSDYHDFTEEEWEIVRSRHWSAYDSWVKQVAEWRGLELSELDSLARGRVWTGQQAMERRLVDHVGGFDVAMVALKEDLGIPPGQDVKIVHLPEPRTFLEQLLEDGNFTGWKGRMLLALSRLFFGSSSPLRTWMPELEIADPAMIDGAWLWRIR